MLLQNYGHDNAFPPSSPVFCPYVGLQKRKMRLLTQTKVNLAHARFMQCQICIVSLHCEPEVGWVIWRSIWSLAQFSYIWARQRRTRSNTLFAPSDLVTCTPGRRPL